MPNSLPACSVETFCRAPGDAPRVVDVGLAERQHADAGRAVLHGADRFPAVELPQERAAFGGVHPRKERAFLKGLLKRKRPGLPVCRHTAAPFQREAPAQIRGIPICKNIVSYKTVFVNASFGRAEISREKSEKSRQSS